MVDAVSILVGASTVLGLAIFALSYGALYLQGRLKTVESERYVDKRDIDFAEAQRHEAVEDARRERVRDVEVTNTAASIKDERVAPSVEQSGR